MACLDFRAPGCDHYEGLRIRIASLTELVEIDIHEQPEPERMEKVELEPLLTVEDPKPQEIAVEEVQEGADIQR